MEAYAAFAMPADAIEIDPADKFWSEGPVRWILSDGEKKEWTSLSDANLRVAFVERFWVRAPRFPAGQPKLSSGIRASCRFRDAYLAHDAEQRGSLTDRGMVFILLGPPKTACAGLFGASRIRASLPVCRESRPRRSNWQ